MDGATKFHSFGILDDGKPYMPDSLCHCKPRKLSKRYLQKLTKLIQEQAKSDPTLQRLLIREDSFSAAILPIK